MHKPKRLAALLAGAVVVVGIAAWSSVALGGGEGMPQSQSKDSASIRVGYFQIAAINAFAQAAQKGTIAAAKKFGGQVDAFDANFDPAKQLAQIQDAITTGKYKAFVIFATSGTAILPAVRQALAKGIKVTAIFTPLGPDFLDLTNAIKGVSSMVGESEREVALGEAQMTVAACGSLKLCKVVYLEGLPTFPPAKGRFDVWKQAIAAHKNIQVVATQPANFAASPAVTAMQNILQAHPDVNVVTTDGDQMSFGAETAIKSAGLTSKIKITGNGGGKLGLTAIQQGRWYGTIYSEPYTMGYLAGQYAIQAVQGKRVPSAVNLFNQQRKADTGPVLTKRNVSKVTAQWTG